MAYNRCEQKFGPEKQMTLQIDLALTSGQDEWIFEHFILHRLFTHFFPASQFFLGFPGFPCQHSPSAQTPLLQIKCFLQGIKNHYTPFSFLTISYQKENFLMHSAKTKFSPQVWFYYRIRPFLQHSPIKCFDQIGRLAK